MSLANVDIYCEVIEVLEFDNEMLVLRSAYGLLRKKSACITWVYKT